MANASSKNPSRGRAAEFLVAFDFAIKGFSPVLNPDGQSPYDLLLEIGRGRILKVQVKSTSRLYRRAPSGSPCYRFQFTKFDKARYKYMDLYAFVALDIQTICYFSPAHFQNRSKSTTMDFNARRFMSSASGSLERVLREI